MLPEVPHHRPRHFKRPRRSVGAKLVLELVAGSLTVMTAFVGLAKYVVPTEVELLSKLLGRNQQAAAPDEPVDDSESRPAAPTFTSRDPLRDRPRGELADPPRSKVCPPKDAHGSALPPPASTVVAAAPVGKARVKVRLGRLQKDPMRARRDGELIIPSAEIRIQLEVAPGASPEALREESTPSSAPPGGGMKLDDVPENDFVPPE